MRGVGAVIASAVARLGVAAVLWVAVTEAGASALQYGLVIVPVAAAASYALVPWRRGADRGAGRPRAVGIVRAAGRTLALSGWILWRSVVGGLDVARRAVWLPRVDVTPVWSVYETRLRSRGARAALALVMNLMPGTLSARLDGALIDVHAIAADMDVEGSIRALEARLAAIEADLEG